jgi:diaminopropionate ammonia-lyase
MAGLNCGLPSPIAFPKIRETSSAFAAIGDSWACDTMRALADEDLVAGETEGAGLAGLAAVISRDGEVAEALGLGPTSRILALITEGTTDPEAYERIV